MSSSCVFFRVGRGVRCFSLAMLVAAGCSKGDGGFPGTVPVTGKLAYHGQPLAGASITFTSDGSETPGAAMSGPDGTYSLRVKPGHYTATVSKLSETAAGTGGGGMEEAMANVDKPTEEAKETLPAKYQNTAESPLKFEVKASGPNQCDAELSD